MCALVTAMFGIAFQPRRQLSSRESCVFTWLLGQAELVVPLEAACNIKTVQVEEHRINVYKFNLTLG
jgi:hypothetical protein